ncbi:hypothetical protein SAMN05421773_101720 [Streptomyces aidingensis]|uniref:Uncharacterized protein n=1 Tax=Streptomyces aidingensis TaxID=910347 RepID=A0A1I1FH80_9ACTN|nr:hypothetical protein SAMN05421773_101720 [Streptomyces aidingensis]
MTAPVWTSGDMLLVIFASVDSVRAAPPPGPRPGAAPRPARAALGPMDRPPRPQPLTKGS